MSIALILLGVVVGTVSSIIKMRILVRHQDRILSSCAPLACTILIVTIEIYSIRKNYGYLTYILVLRL